MDPEKIWSALKSRKNARAHVAGIKGAAIRMFTAAERFYAHPCEAFLKEFAAGLDWGVADQDEVLPRAEILKGGSEVRIALPDQCDRALRSSGRQLVVAGATPSRKHLQQRTVGQSGCIACSNSQCRDVDSAQFFLRKSLTAFTVATGDTRRRDFAWLE